MRSKLRGALTIATLLAVAPLLLAADSMPNQRVEVVGRGGTKAGNKAAAYARAEEDAIRQAVENVAEQLIGHEAVVSGYPLLKERILKKPSRYVQEFQITERVDKGTTVIVRMICQIQTETLADDLTAIGLLGVPPSGLPRVAVLPDPKNELGWWNRGGKNGAPAPLTDLLVKALRERGFEVIDPKVPKKGLAPKAPVGDIRKFAAAQGAEVVLAVRWSVASDESVTDAARFVAARAKLTSVTALTTKGGDKLAATTADGVAGRALDLTEKVPKGLKTELETAALKQAAESAAGHLAEALGGTPSQQTKTLQLVVAGLTAYAELVRFQQALAKLGAVGDVMIGGAERGEFRFTVALKGTPKELATQIGKSDLGGFKVKVTEQKDDRVVVHVNR